MFCNKCGRLVEEGSKFCGHCGAPIDVPINNGQNMNEMSNKQSIQNEIQNSNQLNQNQYNNVQNQNYDKAVNPSMKKYAIASIIIPAISIVVYWYIGLTVYIAVLLAALGYGFANKGRLFSKNLSIIGYVLNTILVIMAIIMFIFSYIENFA